MKYEKHRPGGEGWSSWVHPIQGQGDQQPRAFYKLCCCDCGLVHDVDFRPGDTGLLFRVRRNNRATGQVRRWQKKGPR